MDEQIKRLAMLHRLSVDGKINQREFKEAVSIMWMLEEEHGYDIYMNHKELDGGGKGRQLLIKDEYGIVVLDEFVPTGA